MAERAGSVEGLAVDPVFWAGRRVLLTGHTGFKGAWLAFWLAELGAEVTGVALEAEQAPNLFGILGLESRVTSVIADINDRPTLDRIVAGLRPEVILHLAAQSLVRPSYENPVETIATNVVGVANILDAGRACPDLRAVVVVTSDKCYENREWVWGYREIDPLGGRDPYSASKGCAEIVAASMRRSFFKPHAPNGHPAGIATVRAGNVIGGGDWSRDRLVPDIVRGCLGPAGEVRLRNPAAVRPWQHVLEPLAAYLGLCQQLAAGGADADDAWNFGPDESADQPVGVVADRLTAALGRGRIVIERSPDAPHEATLLRLDCSKVRQKFGWRPAFDFARAVEMTALWYRAWNDGQDMNEFTRGQIQTYVAAAAARGKAGING